MKIKKISAIIAISLSLLFSLTGCSKTIWFEQLNFNPPIRSDAPTQYPIMQMVTAFKSKCEVENYFANNDYFSEKDIEYLNIFDDKYFENNALLIICTIAGDNYNFNTTKITINSNELFVHIQASKITVKTKYYYKFVKVLQNEIKKVTKYSYVYKTI